MNEPKVIVLRPYQLGDTADAVVYGATRIAADCGHEAWIAPSSRPLVQRENLLTVCVNCMPDGAVDARRTPGAYDELSVHMGDVLTEAMLRTAKTMGSRGELKSFLTELQEER